MSEPLPESTTESTSESTSGDSAPDERGAAVSQIAILAIMIVVGLLAAVAAVFVVHHRLTTEIASDGQDTSASNLGLSAQGFLGTPAQGTQKSTPVAQIAATLMAKAFSFTPQGFDAQVAAAKKSMNASMQQRYSLQLQHQNTRALVTSGMTVTTSLVHYKGVAKNYAYLGVVSLTETEGEFLMLFQRSTTRSGSRQAQVTPFMLDVTVTKIGNTWVLSDVQGI